uniref:Uncharacterized protein n=1 Tax=Triticum urartu TaxID=4572 RepID=A0A8R7UJN4_TRIUA
NSHFNQHSVTDTESWYCTSIIINMVSSSEVPQNLLQSWYWKCFTPSMKFHKYLGTSTNKCTPNVLREYA